MFAFYMLVLEIWVMWAFIALPIMGIAKLSHDDELAQGMIRSLKWKILRFRKSAAVRRASLRKIGPGILTFRCQRDLDRSLARR